MRGHYSYIDPTGKRVTVNYTADQNGFQIVKGDGSSQGGGGQAMRGSGMGGGGSENDDNNAVDDNGNDNEANTDDETPLGSGSETGPFGGEYNGNALDNAN